jgi:hypothetical protein
MIDRTARAAQIGPGGGAVTSRHLKGVCAVFRSNSKTVTTVVIAWCLLGGNALAEDSLAAKSEATTGDDTNAGSGAIALEQQHQNDNRPAKNGVFLEGLGPGLLYSLNYERLVVDELAVRVGFSYWSVSATATSGGSSASASASFFTVPVTATYVGLRGLEAGGGMTLMHASGSGSTVGASASGSGFAPLGIALVGYRLHPVGGPGFQFRVGGMAMMGKGLSLSASDPTAFGVLPWLYLSAGAGF